VIYKRRKWYWADFSVDGTRYRKPLKTRNWQKALEEERKKIEAARKGQLETQAGPKRLFEAVGAYLAQKEITCSPRTTELEGERLSVVKQHFGDVRLAAIRPDAIAAYQRARHEAGIANRTINMDVGALRRVLKQCGRWRMLEERVKNLPENQQPVGRALTVEEQDRLFGAATTNPKWEHVYNAAIIAANTSMRPVEVKNLRWENVDLFEAIVTIQRSKNVTSRRVIPLNKPARSAFARMLERAKTLGFDQPEHYIWPACRWGRIDPTKPIKKWDSAWRSLRTTAKLPGLRFHDLRHTIVTELVEMGVPDHVIESITGHLSRRMIEHYSHVRIDAKRKALEDLDAWREEAAARKAGAARIH
ncbi:MAG: tyrosine-type recombinase/integrase, partial [Acidobacteria bacterium]|nr:tyrosine-type recombinase/integrase [Acidobacteriota bacterium]